MRDYRAWHDEYDRPGSALAQRLQIVQQRLDRVLRLMPPGPIRVISMCAGQGRDILGVLPGHPRRGDVTATLIELDPRNIDLLTRALAERGLERQLAVLETDAGVSTVYAALVPADIVLACGIFGNISDSDVENTVRNLPMLCSPGAYVLWTRHRGEPDLTPMVRRWLVESGFEETSFDALANDVRSAVGVARLERPPLPFETGVRFFTFLR